MPEALDTAPSEVEAVSNGPPCASSCELRRLDPALLGARFAGSFVALALVPLFLMPPSLAEGGAGAVVAPLEADAVGG